MRIVTLNVAIATEKLLSALTDASLTETELPLQIDKTKTQQTIDLQGLPKPYLRALMGQSLSPNQRTLISSALGDKTKILNEEVVTPNALGKLLKILADGSNPTVEIQVASRWYPVPVSGVRAEPANENFGAYCSLQAGGKIVDQDIILHATWTETDFRDENKNQIRRTVRDLLEAKGVRVATEEAMAMMREKNQTMSEYDGKKGVVISSVGNVMVSNKYLWRGSLDAMPLGTREKPRQLVLEPELERDSRDRSGYRGESGFSLPFVRAFSLDLKKYVYVDVEDIQEYKFQENALEKIVLPTKMHSILSRIFQQSTSEIFGDIFKGRHGGMIVLANGPQGVGKTLTAEVFAEHTKRPLYVLEMGELGTNLSSVEESLQKIFARAARWNAVLLFDEADVFLAKRLESDLERSAIVGVFLRLLDRYEGMFFLTTNRAEVIDPAFRSRITLKLDYPALDPSARTRVWKEMLREAGFNFQGNYDTISEYRALDGRQIRNTVRLLKVMFGIQKEITTNDVLEALEYVALNK